MRESTKRWSFLTFFLESVRRIYGKRLLVLEDGTVFEGTGFGADTYVSGELVLNSAMTGYQELITDQSYKGQILAFTFPVIGTTGINRDDYESIFPGCLAVVVHQLAIIPVIGANSYPWMLPEETQYSRDPRSRYSKAG